MPPLSIPEPLVPVLGGGAVAVQLLGAPASVTPSPFASQVAGSTPVVTGPDWLGEVAFGSLLAIAFACLWCLCLPVVATGAVAPVAPVATAGSVGWGGTVTVSGGTVPGWAASAGVCAAAAS